jgi:hypothetical protein
VPTGDVIVAANKSNRPTEALKFVGILPASTLVFEIEDGFL